MTRHAQKTENLTETVRKVSKQKGTEIHHGQWHGNSYRVLLSGSTKWERITMMNKRKKKKTNTRSGSGDWGVGQLVRVLTKQAWTPALRGCLGLQPSTEGTH